MRRPVDKGLAKRSKLPKVSKAWAVEGKLGGWDAVQDKFFAGQARRGGIKHRLRDTDRAAPPTRRPVAAACADRRGSGGRRGWQQPQQPLPVAGDRAAC